MGRTMTAEEWAQIFPEWPRPPATAMADTFDTNFVDVLSAIFLFEPWPGLVEPDEEEQAGIVERIGRWYLSRRGIHCLGTDMFIAAHRLDEPDWLYHLSKKRIYDPSDFLKILVAARAAFIPEESEAERSTAIERQLAHDAHYRWVLIHPDILRRYHVYFVQRMFHDAEREAFCSFLAAKGYVARR